MRREIVISGLIALAWVVAMVVLHWDNAKLNTTAIYYAGKS